MLLKFPRACAGHCLVVRNIKLRDLLSKGPKYREPVSYSWHQNFDIIMDACEEYARRWAKKEDVEVDTLSEWIKSIADVLKRRIRRLKHSVNTRHESIFSDPDVVRELSRLHENFVIAPADKASNNYTFQVTFQLHFTSFTSFQLYNSSHCSTTILSKHITCALTAVLLLAIVMSIIFGPLKTLPRSSKSCDCVTFRVLKYLLSTFLLYTPHCHMI